MKILQKLWDFISPTKPLDGCVANGGCAHFDSSDCKFPDCTDLERNSSAPKLDSSLQHSE